MVAIDRYFATHEVAADDIPPLEIVDSDG